ncbi:hypothetical protein ACNUDN_21635 [Mycobacterium sp. smrl_JER01]|uniref:hypothetical protein n=1 Tax=Mycobacterium sp. smrl_JER01 TaxID=3402633 RepID=UPI003ABF27C8
MSITRDFIVGTDIETPSTVNVTVLCEDTAVAPAKIRASKVAATSNRSNGERVR